MNRLSKHHFWEWFKRHNHEYIDLQKKPKKEIRYWLNELNAHLRAYYKFLGFSLENKEKTATLTINVEGNATHFKKVEDLVAKAPPIPAWTIKALEDPRPIDFLLENEMQELCVDPREMYFSFISDEPGHAVLIVYHSLCAQNNQYLIHHLAHTAVYNLLGERSFGTNIARLQVANLSTADPLDIEKLEKLPACIGLQRSSIMVDRKGNLISMLL